MRPPPGHRGATPQAAPVPPRSGASGVARVGADRQEPRASRGSASGAGRVRSGGPAASGRRRPRDGSAAPRELAARIPVCPRRRRATLTPCRTRRRQTPAMSSRQKSRLLPAKTKRLSDKFAGANLADRRSARRVPAEDRPAQKAPQATFSHRLVRAPCADRRRRRPRRAVLALLVESLANTLALEVGEIIDEQPPLEVIHLVLDAHGENALVIALETLPVAILSPHAHP